MTEFSSRPIDPPSEDVVFPYRRVWPSIALETGIPFALALILTFVGDDLLREGRIRLVATLVIATVPALVWVVVSWLRERTVSEPRDRLLTVAIICALCANAIGIPLLNNALAVQEWLSLGTTLERIIGYTFTFGAVQEVLKYVVLRYAVWETLYRTRLDAIAYGVAAAMGYATMQNVVFVLANNPPLSVAADRTFATLVLHIISSVIVAYGMAEARLSRQPSPFLLVSTVVLGSSLVGLATPLRVGLVNAAVLARPIAATRPIRGLLFSAVLLIAISVAMAFLFNVAERQAREAMTEA